MNIDRIIHSFWDGPPMPDWVKRSIASWEEHYPGWEIKIWNERTLPTLRNQDLYDNWRTVSPKSNEWQFKTNLARLELIYDQSGYWFDADLMALRNAEDLLNGHSAVVARESNQYVCNGMFGATQGHPFVAELLERAPQRILANPRWRSNRTCGPHLFNDVVWNHSDVGVLSRDHVFPSRWDQLHMTPDDFPDSYFFHWWGNKRSQRLGV